MKTFTVELEVGTKKAIKNIGDLEDEIERLSNELKGADFGSDEFKRLSNELIKAQKQIKNTELSLESLDSEQVASEFGSVVGAVGDMTGAMVLLGGTGGAVEETAENIEKAIGISMAFKGAIEGISSGMKLFNNLVKTNTLLQKANNTITLMASAVMKTFTGSVNTTSVAFKGLRTAIITTGIGALIVGIGVLIANFDKLKDAISGISQAQRDRLDASNKAVENAEYEYELFKLQENSLRLQGKTDEQIQKMKIKYLRGLLTLKMQQLELQQKIHESELESEKSNAKIAKTVVQVITWIVSYPPRLVSMAVEEIATAVFSLFDLILEHPVAKMVLGDQGAFADKLLKSFKENFKPSTMMENFIDEAEDWAVSLIFDPKATEKAAKDNIKELKKGIAQILSDMDGLKLNLKKSDEDEIKSKRQKAQEIIDIEEQQWYLLQQIRNKAREQEILNLQREYDKKQELANGNAELEKALEDKLQQEVNAINEKYRKLEEQAEIDAILKRQKLDEDARQRRIAAAQDDLQMAANAANSIQAIGDAVFAHKMKNLEEGSAEEEEMARKQFKFNKALQLGMAIIDAGKAITASLAQAPIAIGPIPNPAGIASLAFAGVTSAAQIATIAAQQFQSTGAATPSAPSPSIGGGGLGSQAPQFNIVGQSGFNQIASAIGQQPPLQAYVVAQDVTTAQQLQNNTIQTATF